MKYTTDEALSEILRRGEAIALRRSHRACHILSGAACALFAALLVVIGFQPGRAATALSGTVYGAFLLSAEAGGYILAAVIGFALGAAVTLLFVRRNSTSTETEHKEESS